MVLSIREKVRTLEDTLEDAVRNYNELEEQESSLRVAFNDLAARTYLLEDEKIAVTQERDECREHNLLLQRELEELKKSIKGYDSD